MKISELPCFHWGRALLVVALVIAATGGITLRHRAATAFPPAPLARTQLPPPKVLLEGFRTSERDDHNQLLYSLRIGKCEARFAEDALWGLVANNTIEMSDVEADLFSREKPDPPGGDGQQPAEIAAVLKCVKGLPAVFRWEDASRLQIRDVKINLHEPGDAVIAIQARRLTPGSQGEMILEGRVTITTDGGARQLSTSQVIWWPRLRLFAARDRFLLRDRRESQRGDRTLFNLQLQAIRNQEEVRHYEQAILR